MEKSHFNTVTEVLFNLHIIDLISDFKNYDLFANILKSKDYT